MRSGSTSASVGYGPMPEDPVLRLQDDLHARRDVVRDERRHADPEVDVYAVAKLLDGAPDDAFAVEHCGRLVIRSFASPCAARSASRAAPRRPAARRLRACGRSRDRARPTSTSSSTSAIEILPGRRRHRIEVARRLPVDEVAQPVALPRGDEREVADDAPLEDVLAPVEDLRSPCPRATSVPTPVGV